MSCIYPLCELDGHGNEPLSRLCIDSECKARTLICCICEHESHSKHKTTPLKTFLKRIQVDQSNDSSFVGLNPFYFTNVIDSLREAYFTQLDRQQAQINQVFDQLRSNGNLYFAESQQSILSLLKMNYPEKLLSENTQRGIKTAKMHFNKLLSFVNLEESGVFSLQSKLQKFVEIFKEKQEKMDEYFKGLTLEVEKTLMKNKELFESSLILGSQELTVKWSESLKGHKIKLKGNVAEQTSMEASGQRFAMLEPLLSQSVKSRWGIKVIKFVGWIGVGICLRNQIKNGNYVFSYTTIGHGSYMISSNGYTWSHSALDMNSVMKSFQFSTLNQIVYIEYDPKEGKIRFQKGSNPADKYMLTVAVPPMGDSYCPCVNLCSTGDSVEVINPGIALS